jgi:hypothetical protein
LVLAVTVAMVLVVVVSVAVAIVVLEALKQPDNDIIIVRQKSSAKIMGIYLFRKDISLIYHKIGVFQLLVLFLIRLSLITRWD